MELASKLCSESRLESGEGVCYARQTWHPKGVDDGD